MDKEALTSLEVIVFGQFCWNSLGQVRCFGELGIKSHVVWVKGETITPRKSRYIKSFQVFPTMEEGLEFILSTFNDPGRKYLISTDCDAIVSLLDRNYDRLKGRYIFFNAGEQGRLSRFLEKDEQIRMAEAFGLRVPATWVVKRGTLPPDLRYPVFTKSRDSFSYTWKGNAHICRNEQELLAAYDAITADEVILQQFIDKDNEVALEGISYNDGRDLCMPVQGEYLRIEPGSFGTWKRNEEYRLGEELKTKIHDIMRHVGFNGVFEVEFLRDKQGDLYFLEINFRHTQYNHALAVMGFNPCELFALSQLSGTIPADSVKVKSPSITMNDYKEFNKYIKTGRISLFRWIGDILKTDSFYFYDKKDKIYMYRIFAGKIKRKLLRQPG